MSAELKLHSILNDMSESSCDEDLWIKLFSYMSFCDIHALVYHHLPPSGTLDYKENLVVKKQFKSTKDNLAEFVNFVFELKLRKGARVMDQMQYWNYSAAAAKEFLDKNEALADLNISHNINLVLVVLLLLF